MAAGLSLSPKLIAKNPQFFSVVSYSQAVASHMGPYAAIPVLGSANSHFYCIHSRPHYLKSRLSHGLPNWTSFLHFALEYAATVIFLWCHSDRITPTLKAFRDSWLKWIMGHFLNLTSKAFLSKCPFLCSCSFEPFSWSILHKDPIFAHRILHTFSLLPLL